MTDKDPALAAAEEFFGEPFDPEDEDAVSFVRAVRRHFAGALEDVAILDWYEAQTEWLSPRRRQQDGRWAISNIYDSRKNVIARSTLRAAINEARGKTDDER
jgi:hypothetical protein